MPRPIKSIDIYLPLDYNDGSAIEESKFLGIQRELMQRFGGVTSIQQQFPLLGQWYSGGHIYQDKVVVLTAMDFQSKTDLELIRYLEGLKKRLKKKLDQIEILITVQDLLAI